MIKFIVILGIVFGSFSDCAEPKHPDFTKRDESPAVPLELATHGLFEKGNIETFTTMDKDGKYPTILLLKKTWTASVINKVEGNRDGDTLKLINTGVILERSQMYPEKVTVRLVGRNNEVELSDDVKYDDLLAGKEILLKIPIKKKNFANLVEASGTGEFKFKWDNLSRKIKIIYATGEITIWDPFALRTDSGKLENFDAVRAKIERKPLRK